MKKQIFLFASEISIITGHNKFEDKSKVFSRLLSEYYPKENQKMIEILKSKGFEINPIDNKKYIEKVAKKYKMNIDESLSKTLDSSSITSLNNCKRDLINSIEKELTKNNVSENEKKEVIKSVKSLANTNFGTKHENSGINKYVLENNETVIETKEFFKKKIIETTDYDVFIGGRVDGLCYNDKGELYKILEVKNRMYRLFKKLKDYEKIQCHIYMKLLDIYKLDLIECLKTDNPEYNIIEVEYDSLFYENEIEARIFNFINYFIDIMHDSNISYDTLIYETSVKSK